MEGLIWDHINVAEYHPEKMSGSLVFRGTRMPARDTNQYFLLKIHDSIGEGAAQSATHIDARVSWLAEFGQVASFAIQKAVPNRDGAFVSTGVFPHS